VARTRLRHRINSWAVGKALGIGSHMPAQGQEAQ
jgi:hypothetical protein